MPLHALVLLLVGALLGACTPLPQRAGVPTRWVPSPNFDERRPNFIVIHHTGSDSAAHALQTLTDPRRMVSAHYLIARDGTISQLVDERARAWHAGESYWGGNTDLNSSSIGIELDNDGEEPFPEPQIGALLALLEDLTERLRVPATNVLGHGDVAPGRKVDPSRHFPWHVLARHGFGLWCDEAAGHVRGEGALPSARAAADALSDSQWREAVLLLQALGYDATDPDAASAAYLRHFREEDARPLTAPDLALLRCLVSRSGAVDGESPAAPSGE